MANYSFEKGKYGGVTGTIFPYMRQLPDGVDISTGDWKEYIPAGYLKCDGSVLSADQYPQLARVVGIGSECIYKKDNIILQNQLNDRGGTFQLPDLGSKFITGGSASGSYLNAFIEDPETGELSPRVGVEVAIESAVGNTVTFNYTGAFSFPQTQLQFSGNFAPTISSRTPTANIFDVQMLPHGHHSTTSYPFQGPRRERVAADNGIYGGAYRCCSDLVLVTAATSAAGSEAQTSHGHSLERQPITNNLSGNMKSTVIPTAELTTTVRLNVEEDTTEFPDIVPAYVLVEYLIKV